MPTSLYEKATKHMETKDFRSFSEYVASLIRADIGSAVQRGNAPPSPFSQEPVPQPPALVGEGAAKEIAQEPIKRPRLQNRGGGGGCMIRATQPVDSK